MKTPIADIGFTEIADEGFNPLAEGVVQLSRKADGLNITTVSSSFMAYKDILRRHGLGPRTRSFGLVIILQKITLEQGFFCTVMAARSHSSSVVPQTRTLFSTTQETCYSIFARFAKTTQVIFYSLYFQEYTHQI